MCDLPKESPQSAPQNPKKITNEILPSLFNCENEKVVAIATLQCLYNKNHYSNMYSYNITHAHIWQAICFKQTFPELNKFIYLGD